MDGEVTTRVETAIPNTDMNLFSFNVNYRRTIAEGRSSAGGKCYCRERNKK